MVHADVKTVNGSSEITLSFIFTGEQQIPKPIILTNPESQDAFKGENISLKCETAITGDSEPTIQWKKDNMVSKQSFFLT